MTDQKEGQLQFCECKYRMLCRYPRQYFQQQFRDEQIYETVENCIFYMGIERKRAEANWPMS